MKVLLTPILFFLLSNLNAQDQIPQIDGKVVYQFIDTVEGSSKEDIFNKARVALTSKILGSVLKIDIQDKESGLISGKGTFDIYLSKGAFKGDSYTNFDFELQCKENRYRLRIYNLTFEGKYNYDILYSLYKKDNDSKKNYEGAFTWASIRTSGIADAVYKKVRVKDDF